MLVNTKKVIGLHAASVILNGSAFVFLGPSGAGKSTICRLLADYANATLLADDKIFIAEIESGFYVSDATDHPFAARLIDSFGALMQLDSIPLGSIVRIYQSSSTCMESITALEGCCLLTKSYGELMINLKDKCACRENFALMAKLSRVTQMYRLNFTLFPADLVEVFSKD